jgi:diguanylate cyclase (GGDEF)-like protein/PAS domain S-box-containing protein
VPDEIKASHSQYRSRYSKNRVPRKMALNRELSGVHKDGTRVPLEISLMPVQLDNTSYTLTTITNLSDRFNNMDKFANSTDKYAAMFNTAKSGMALCDMDGRLVEFNQSFLNIIGYDADEALSLTYWDLTPIEYQAMETKMLDTLKVSGKYGPYEKKYRRKDKSLVPVLLNGTIIKGQDGDNYIWSVIQDMTNIKQFEDKLNLLSRAVDSTTSEIIIMDITGRIEFINQSFMDAAGFSWEDIMGKSFNYLVADNFQPQIKDIMRVIDEFGEYKNNIFHQKKDGTVYCSRTSISAIKNDNNQVTHFICIMDDISNEQKAEREIKFLAEHDQLTQLINRYEFDKRLKNSLINIKENNNTHAFCYIDLDQFKVVNDTCGHMAGDELLRQISSKLRHVVRSRDTLARLGGDEFGLLIENCAVDKAYGIAEKMLDLVREHQFFWENKQFRIGASIGLVVIDENMNVAETIMKLADAACYIAKDHGRNRIHIMNNEDKEIGLRETEMEWVSKIHTALEQNRFVLYAQEIKSSFNNNSGIYFEVLIRMLDESNKVIPPGAFLPSAERYNLIGKIDQWVVINTIDYLLANSAICNKLDTVSINISGQSMTDESFMNFLITQLERIDISNEKFCFEITETSAITSYTAASNFIKTLTEIGCKFALDDFGSGASSYAYLKNLPVHYLKIDGMFVKDILQDKIDLAMVKSIKEIANVMGMSTIAEFVENDQIIEILRDIGVDYIQGYGVAMPIPIEQLKNNIDNVIKLDKLKK